MEAYRIVETYLHAF